ncbi:hypothetical protein D1641_12775 [Colidextribacter sp. OB.20]|uniref:hypothetical protein n=1 Tax=Colidextribacter sp. OB.20 TaxID=2304568 RepID=UPI0013713EB1|nr:hypothetical protein [Colidextribacter sp. OB.20]NBI10880.1 hypothetical protein [Colidextribacter sp. OB.20]
MGLFSSLFGGGAKKAEEVNDANAQALKQFFREKLPANYVNSPKYAISITRGDKGYEARINLDMGSDGSDYSGFGKDDFAGLADMESGYVFDEFVKDPPVTVIVTFDMDFGPRNRITVNKGRALAK